MPAGILGPAALRHHHRPNRCDQQAGAWMALEPPTTGSEHALLNTVWEAMEPAAKACGGGVRRG